jgi:hypothetical protein
MTKKRLAVFPKQAMINAMKTVLAIIFSLMLAVAPGLSARPMPACPIPVQVAAKHCACCPAGVTMPCCAAKPVTNSEPAPLALAPTGASLPLLILQPAFSPVALHRNTSVVFSNVPLTCFTASDTPLYERNCVLLI